MQKRDYFVPSKAKSAQGKRKSNASRLLEEKYRWYTLVAAAFAIVFVAVGTIHIISSQAANNPSLCVNNTYSIQLQPEYVTCVAHLQYVLNNWATASYEYKVNPKLYPKPLALDGSYGPATQNAVRAFQSWVKISSDGVTGDNTWYWLCDSAAYMSFKYDDVGCVAKWSYRMQHPYSVP